MCALSDYDAVLAEMIGQFPDSLLCSKSRKLVRVFLFASPIHVVKVADSFYSWSHLKI